MSIVGRARAAMAAVFLHQRATREMREEMQSHIEQAAERFMQRGMSEQEALQAARREFGNTGALREAGRDARGARWVGVLLGDVRNAFRYFARTKAMTITIVFILLLGITVNAAVFAMADGVLNRPPPGVSDDPSLVTVRGKQLVDHYQMERQFSYPEFLAYAQRTDLFSAVAGWVNESVVVDMGDAEEGIGAASAQFVTPNFFQILGATPAHGTTFLPTPFTEHTEPELSAVLSETFARERFGSASDAVGKPLRINDVVVRVVGVAPNRFNGAIRNGTGRTIWLPLSSWRVVQHITNDPFSTPDSSYFDIVARLQPKTDVVPAQASVTAIARQARANVISRNATMRYDTHIAMVTGDRTDFDAGSDTLPLVTALVTIIVLILLVCTTTVGSLIVASSARRRNEIAVRLALGASRGRIIRQLLTESTILALIAAALGVAVFAAVVRAFANQMRAVDVSPTLTTGLVTAAIAIVAALLCGLSPALHATRHSLNEVLKSSSTGATSRSRLQRMFVVSQVALAQPLLVCLGVVVVDMLKSTRESQGSNIENQLVVVDLFVFRGGSVEAKQQLRAVEDRLQALPVVKSAIAQVHGYMMYNLKIASAAEARASTFGQNNIPVFAQMTPPGYFETMDMPILAGRGFTADDELSIVGRIVIPKKLADQLFPGQNPIGKRLTRLNAGPNQDEAEIIGVVGTARTTLRAPENKTYIFVASTIESPGSLLVRFDRPAAPFIPSVRAIIAAEAPKLPIRRINTLEQIARRERQSLLQATGAAAAAGMLVLMLASVGLYAVVALSVSQRSREIGIRIAVGARPKQVIGLFFGRGVRLSLLGLAIGLPLGVGALKLLQMRSRGMPHTNFTLIATCIALLVLSIAALASWLPARRAANVNPLVALGST